MIVMYMKGPMEWLLDVQRVCRVCMEGVWSGLESLLGMLRGSMEWLLGVYRACEGGAWMVCRGCAVGTWRGCGGGAEGV